MLLGRFLKQPNEKYDYDISYAEWLTTNDNLESTVVEVFPIEDESEADRLVIETVVVMDPILKIWVSGGKNGVTYKVTLISTTADGRVKEDEIKLKIKDI